MKNLVAAFLSFFLGGGGWGGGAAVYSRSPVLTFHCFIIPVLKNIIFYLVLMLGVVSIFIHI